MTDLRDATAAYAAAWGRSGVAGRVGLAALAAIAAALAGAFLFGAWHILVGGLVKGNPRAGAFGLGLSAVAGLALGALWLGVRRAVVREGDPA